MAVKEIILLDFIKLVRIFMDIFYRWLFSAKFLVKDNTNVKNQGYPEVSSELHDLLLPSFDAS